MKTTCDIITKELIKRNIDMTIDHMMIATDEDWLIGKRIWFYVDKDQREKVEEIISVITPIVSKSPSFTTYRIKDMKIIVANR